MQPAFESRARQSVLDRLLEQPEPSNRKESIEAAIQSVLRDLDWLLNSRRTPIEVPESYRELRRSVFNYGLPDLTGFGVHSEIDRNRLQRVLENIIADMEPRLADVKVSAPENVPLTQKLKFRIEATLKLQPAPVRVAFDTVMELRSGECKLDGGPRAG
jgi:type VI secretion system protein ImpF